MGLGVPYALLDAVKQVHGRRVDVRFITDGLQGSNIKAIQAIAYLNEVGIPVKKGKRGGAKVNHKFCVVDNTVICTGSFNWTQAAENKNQENFIILRNRQVAEKFAD